MDSYLLLQKQTQNCFLFRALFSVHCLRENALDETVEVITFS